MKSAVPMNVVLVVGVMVPGEAQDERRENTQLVNAKAITAINEIKQLTLEMNKALDALENVVSMNDGEDRKHDL